MNKKLGVQHGQLVSQLYSSDVQNALQVKLEEMQNESRSTKRKIREAEETLEQYRKAGGMENVAREYAEILEASEKVKADIRRLENGRK